MNGGRDMVEAGSPGGTDGWRRRPLWLRIGLGCGALLLLVAGTVGGLGYVVYRKGTAVVERSWKELRATTERLKTVESAKALYRANPGLAELYPTEQEFLKQAELWRPKLGRIPDRPPSLRTLLLDRRTLQVHENRSDGHETVRMKYAFANGTVLEMETDQGRLTDLLLK